MEAKLSILPPKKCFFIPKNNFSKNIILFLVIKKMILNRANSRPGETDPYVEVTGLALGGAQQDRVWSAGS